MKKGILLFTVLISIVSIGNSQNLLDSLIVHYSFDGHSNDLSGNGLHANVMGAVLAADRHGAADSAYFFDGTDDFIQLPIDPKLKPDLPLTISFWVKLETLNYAENRWVSTENVYNNYTGVNMAVSSAGSGTIHVNYGDGNGAGPNYRRTKRSLNALSAIGTWYHIAAVVRGPLDMDLYVDCNNVGGTYSGAGGNIAYVDSTGDLGRIHGLTASPQTTYFWGTMDDFALWNRALSPSEIVQVCNSGLTTSISESLTSYNKISCVVYPNPSQDIFTIKIDNILSGNLYFSLFDASGRLVNSRTINSASSEFSIANLTAGVYYYSIYGEDQTQMKFGKVIAY